MARKVKRKIDPTLNFLARNRKQIVAVAVLTVLLAVYLKSSSKKVVETRYDAFDDGREDVLVADSVDIPRVVDPDVFVRHADDFIQLIDEHYEDEDLVKWEPRPTPISRPGEPGDLGSAVEIPPELEEESKKRFKENEFDVVANELMSINRTLSDSRYPECLKVSFPDKLPPVSVIIVFHNEGWSSLIRTIWSVITQSPESLIKEIILVDDFSVREHLGKKLDDYIATLPVSVKLIRQPSRKGLMQARLEGVKLSSAKVIVFLDAHCECNQGWLEPLLAPIVKSRTSVVVPIIDVINFRTMRYTAAVTESRGIFDMTMTFSWGEMPKNEMNEDRTALNRAPAMAGGLFAMDREYFYEIGSYDEGMVIWGGENIEMSLRIWMCGGRILSAPCSRVGHIFREHSPYDMPGGTNKVIFGNEARFVDVWLDEYKSFFYTVVPEAFKLRTNVSDRIALRKRLQCKSFKWYLENVFPESALNIDFVSISTIKSKFLAGECMDTMARKQNEPVGIGPCHNLGGNQAFMLTKSGELRAKKFCLDATLPGVPVTLYKCHDQKGNQYWQYYEDTLEIKHGNQVYCMTVHENRTITIETCDGSLAQQWEIQAYKPHGNLDLE